MDGQRPGTGIELMSNDTSIGTPFDAAEVKALTFDVFGTVVDWRTSVAAEGRAFGEQHGIEADWVAFADQWRGLYQPSMEAVRSGQREWTRLDDLHRESLDTLAEQFGFADKVDDAALAHFNRAWHRLSPWPDVVEGLNRLRQRFILTTLSNGNVSLMVNLARHAGLPWDTILGAEVCRAYKPLSEAYLGTARFLDLAPGQCMMVAAHNGDLVKAASLGMRTAYVNRPTEYGPHQSQDFGAEHAFDVVADSFTGVAEQLGA